MSGTFTRTLRVDVPVDALFRWHERPGAFERLSPPWERVDVVERTGGIRDGDRTVLRVGIGPITRRWVAEHRDYRENERFTDVQVEGPFASWTHTHAFRGIDDRRAELVDTIDWALPRIAAPFASGSVERTLERVFRYRHDTTGADLAAHAAVDALGPRTIVVSGASGLIGEALCAFLTTGGHTVRRLVRREPTAPDEFRWDPAARSIDASVLDGADAVVHLAGASVAKRWTDAHRRRILDSRVDGTATLVDAMREASDRPATFVCASAIGYYGDCGDRPVDESAPHGHGFLADVTRAWEETASHATDVARTAMLRFGVVLSPRGGALGTMLPAFRFGGGGRIGSGRQVMSWVGVDDAVGAIHRALFDDALHGPVNVVAPEPVTNLVFASTLARVLKRPSILPLPAAVARAAFGDMANEMLLAGCRVTPRALRDAGFTFRHPSLEACLRHLLGR